MIDQPQLTVWCMAPFKPALDPILEPLSAHFTVSYATAEAVIDPCVRGIVVFEDVADALARAADDLGADDQSAIATCVTDWVALTSEALQQVQRSDGRLILISAQDVRAAPQELGRDVAARLGLGALQMADDLSATAGPAARYALMAEVAAQVSPDVADCRRLSMHLQLRPDGAEHMPFAPLGRVADLLAQTSDTGTTTSEAALKAELMRRATALTAKEAEVVTLQADIARLSATLAEQEAFMEQAQHDAAVLRRNLHMRDGRLVAMAEDVQHSQDHVIALNDHVAALHGSTSWRLTGPLRRAILGARKMAGRG